MNKNFSIGVDIESIKRFRDLDRVRSSKFLSRIFTNKEMDYCFSKKSFAQHLAARFAAKEAAVKATGCFGKKKLALKSIEVTRNSHGVPMINLNGYNIKVSLSHSNDYAIAFVVAEKNK